MLFTLSTILAFAAAGSALTLPRSYRDTHGSTSVTPHAQFSSSIGVLGCKINTNRVAYWPSPPDCNHICAKVTANGRSVYLLKIDQSATAFDISYGAWNVLNTGLTAPRHPTSGGGIPATWELVDNEECRHLINEPNGKLAFSAANAMTFIQSCAPDTWVGQNYALYNIANSACTLGKDEECRPGTADEGHVPQCPTTLGLQTPLSSCPVYDLAYPNLGAGFRGGERVLATQ